MISKRDVRMNYKIITAIFCGLLSFGTFAGNEVGNGGVGFWCPKNQNYLFLDFYEYELLNPKSKITSSQEDFKEIIQKKLSLLSKLDSKIAANYSRHAEQIFVKINFLENITLNKTSDSFEVAQPEGCEVKQFALQRKRESDHTTEFFFDKNIWSKLNETEKAGLILHEIIYDQFSYLGENNSIKVRKFNSFIFSSNFEKTLIKDYKKFIKDLKIPLY